MQRARGRFGSGGLALGCLLTVLTSACGDDESPPKKREDAGSDTDRDADTPSMRIPTGGRGGGGGTGGTPMTDESAWMCVPKPGDVGGPKESGAECCDGLGTCSGEAGDANAGLPHETCKANPELRCVPKPPTSEEDGGTAGFASCSLQLPGAPPSAASYEGRCLPNCFVRHSPIASRLSQANCDDGETCAPCYNPLTGRSTGTCERLGDSPLEPPPPGFAECSDGLGYCVPTYAAGSSAGQLSQLTCVPGELCAPKVKVGDPSACFERCDAGLLGPGACVPEFLAGPGALFLLGAGCRPAELCAPCVALGARTGVCD